MIYESHVRTRLVVQRCINVMIWFCCFAGAAVAQYAGINLHKSVVDRPEYKNGDITTAIREVI